MLLMVEKNITGGLSHFIYRYAKANSKYMKDYDKIKESSYFNIGMWITYMVWQCCKDFQ